MQTIVLVAVDPESGDRLAEMARALFPECTITVLLKENRPAGTNMGKGETDDWRCRTRRGPSVPFQRPGK